MLRRYYQGLEDYEGYVQSRQSTNNIGLYYLPILPDSLILFPQVRTADSRRSVTEGYNRLTVDPHDVKLGSARFVRKRVPPSHDRIGCIIFDKSSSWKYSRKVPRNQVSGPKGLSRSKNDKTRLNKGAS